MSTIRERLEKLEKLIRPIVDPDAAWGKLAALRDDFLRDQAHAHGEAYAADLKKQWEKRGPLAFRIELIRAYLKMNGVEQGPNESFAETMARTLGIGTSELRFRIQDGTFGKELVAKFEGARAATDNGS